jgi:hypothetical protein
MNAGDHLYVDRIGYTHHGIFVGDDRVIHYEGPQLAQPLGMVTEVSLKVFAGGAEVKVQDYPFRTHDAGESVARARSRIGEELYNLFANNCEQFVVWCIMGVPFSKQVAATGSTVGAYFNWLSGSRVAQEELTRSLIGAGAAKSVVTAAMSRLGMMAGSEGLKVTALGGMMGLGAPIIIPSLAMGSIVFALSHWDEIGDCLGDFTDNLFEVGDVILDGAFQVTEDLWDLGCEAMRAGGGLLEEMGEGAIDLCETVLEGLDDACETVLNGIGDAFERFFGFFN